MAASPFIPLKKWLVDKIKSCYGDEELPELVEMILALLRSGSEDLQEELINLCGFERFDMVEAILQRCSELVRHSSHSEEQKEKVVETQVVTNKTVLGQVVNYVLL